MPYPPPILYYTHILNPTHNHLLDRIANPTQYYVINPFPNNVPLIVQINIVSIKRSLVLQTANVK